jgi:50S ribosomal protein L16 3-hydroxylase
MRVNTTQLLGGMSPVEFLQEYWQKQPLLIHAALPGFESSISPDELAGLACEEGINSRIVLEQGLDQNRSSPWQVIYGPQEESIFSHLPESNWTLLITDVEKHLHELADLLDKFRFIPDWRIDDLMISYAAPGGSVGPHVDEYDVFLLQAKGQRRWQISLQKNHADNFIPGLELRILKEFVPEREWVLNPGDMLYLPPGIPHHGIALNECITYSIGFRAPSYAEMLTGFIEYIIQSRPISQRYQDPDLCVQQNPGEITESSLAKVQNLLAQMMVSKADLVEEWFGRFVTEPKNHYLIPPEKTLKDFRDWCSCFKQAGVCIKHPASRFAFASKGTMARLFVDGEAHTIGISFAELLCGERTLRYDASLLSSLSDDEQQLIVKLYNQGSLYFPDDG